MNTLICAVLATGALATADVTGSDSILTLPEVLIVATRVEQPRTAVSVSSTRISAEQFELSPENDLGPVLSQVPDLNLRSYATSRGLKSLGIWGGSSQQVLVTLDGHPIVNCFSGMADLGLLSLTDLSAIEIAHGPGSSLYGANALAGTIGLISRSPADLEPGRLGYDARAAIGLPLKTSLGYRAGTRLGRFGFQGGLGLDRDQGTRTNEHSRSYGMNFGGGYYSPDLTLDFRGLSILRDLGLPGPKPDSLNIPPYGDSTASSCYDHEADHALTLQGNFAWTSAQHRLILSLKPDWSITRTRYWMLSPFAPSPESLTKDEYLALSAGTSLLAHWKPLSQLSVVTGYDLRAEQGWVKSELNDAWQARSLNHGLWVEALASHSFLNANANLRSDWNSDYGRVFNPAFGAAADLRIVRLRASWGTAFRAPTFSDRYWPQSGVRTLRPERGTAFQVGADIPMPGAELSLTGFWRTTRNMIVWLPDSSNLWRPTNLDSARHLGLEGKLRLTPFHDFELEVSGMAIKGSQLRQELVYYDFLTGTARFSRRERPSAFLPALSLGARLAYRLPQGIAFRLDARYKSARYNYYPSYEPGCTVRTETKRLAPFLVLSSELSARLFKGLRFGLQVNNLLNTRYREQFGNSPKDLDYPMPGRSVSLTLRYSTE